MRMVKKSGALSCAGALAALVLTAAVISACATTAPAPDYREEVVSIAGSRGNAIPATLTLPAKGEGPWPVVLLLHGHGGSRHENGGFDQIAGYFAGRGIASLRMDFAGCGDNAESFVTGNRLQFMLDDLASCKEYLASVPQVDRGRIGLFGYSMGGRIAALAAGKSQDCRAVVFLAPAILPGAGDLYEFMQIPDEAAFTELAAQAEREGSVTITNVFGSVQTLGKGWFQDMINIDPLASFAPFTGSFLLITGAKDTIIPTASARTILDAAENTALEQTLEIQEADHGFGMYSDQPGIVRMVAQPSADFFLEVMSSSRAD